MFSKKIETPKGNIVLSSEDGRTLYASSPYQLKERMKELGFLWDKDNRKWWATPTPERLAQIEQTFGVTVFPRSYYKPSEKRPLLRQYQRLGVDFLHRARFAYLGDKAGLGKTAQVLVYADEANLYPMLVVSPASVLYNWEIETIKWTGLSADQVSVVVSDTLPEGKAVYIVSYDRFRRLNKKLPSVELLVLDEGHYLKSPKALRTQAVNYYVKRMRPSSVVILSGTPFLNSPIELWSQLNLLYPSEFPNYVKFGIRYAGGKKGYWGWEFKDITNSDELKTRMSSFYLGRTKKEVLDELPELEIIYLPTSEGLKDYYKVKQEIKKLVDEGRDDLVVRANIFTLRRLVGQLKVPSALEVIDNLGDEKVVIFAVHREVVDALRTALNCPAVTGETPPKERQKIVDEFNKTVGGKLIITQAMQEGVNLQSASHLVMVERLWNPPKEEQVFSRLHRFGQQNRVSVWIPILKDTLDERIHRMLQQKGVMYERVFNVDHLTIKEWIDFI